MQEIHSIGGGGRFFGGDRRLRPHHQQNHQALKCPRCDSLNTKFCYYNNYNLSQPRHFCKNCRRYWTKGGVLRNVPVGGGCRKSKRSNKPKNSTSSEPSAVPTTAPSEPEHKSNSHSSSESSSLTAATATAATEAVSAPTLNTDSNNKMLESMHESKLLISSNAGLETGTTALEQGTGDCGIFSEIGNFTSLIASTNEALPFGFGNGIPDASSFHWQHHKVTNMSEEFKLPANLGGAGSLLDHTVDLSTLHSKTGNGGFGPLDWHSGTDQGLFDLPNTVDQAYWNSTLFHLP